MKHLEELKEVVKRELEKFGKQGDISVSNLDKIHKLSDLYKNLCKIEILEEQGGYSEEMYGNSYAGGRRYAKRDSMGRYSSDGGSYDGDDYSERRTGRGYSRDEATDWMMTRLGEMMSETADPKQREALKKCMRELERD